MDLVKWMLDLGAADRELAADATASNWSFPDFKCPYAKDGEPKIAVPFKGASIEVGSDFASFRNAKGNREIVLSPSDSELEFVEFFKMGVSFLDSASIHPRTSFPMFAHFVHISQVKI